MYGYVTQKTGSQIAGVFAFAFTVSLNLIYRETQRRTRNPVERKCFKRFSVIVSPRAQRWANYNNSEGFAKVIRIKVLRK